MTVVVDDTMSTGAAARLMRVSQSTVQRLCEDGSLRAWRPTDRGWWRVEVASVRQWLSKRSDEMGQDSAANSGARQ